jgi:hypothetical protein
MSDNDTVAQYDRADLTYCTPYVGFGVHVEPVCYILARLARPQVPPFVLVSVGSRQLSVVWARSTPLSSWLFRESERLGFRRSRTTVATETTVEDEGWCCSRLQKEQVLYPPLVWSLIRKPRPPHKYRDWEACVLLAEKYCGSLLLRDVEDVNSFGPASTVRNVRWT